jgi:transcriptional regulator with XRE-family HTH domain/Zn-dependent peptidase ImmA (M78 family)
MVETAENPRFVLGVKLRKLRLEQGRSLKRLAATAGLSISYLSEIEKGKKYPKPEKLLRLAEALSVPYDELVSLQLDEGLDGLRSLFTSTLVREFPFELFGLDSSDLYALITEDPDKAGALIRTFLEVGRLYDVQVEHFLFAALRSYQQMHGNHFARLEREAASFRDSLGWSADDPPDEERLRRALEERHGYRIDYERLDDEPDLAGFRSIFVAGDPPTLMLNRRLLPTQRAFVLGRELGYLHLGLEERAETSSWVEVESFEQLRNNFEASYFSGALLIDRDRLRRDLAALFAAERWDPDALLAMLERYRATPEMFFYRLTEVIPEAFGLKEIFFLRFTADADRRRIALSKVLNMSSARVPHGIGRDEHFCRRWPALRMLGGMPQEPSPSGVDPRPRIAVQRSRFVDEGAEFFVVALTRPLSLAPERSSSVSLGIQVDEAFRRRVRFWDDPEIPSQEVNLTCERCSLSDRECAERAAPPRIRRRELDRESRLEALDRLGRRVRGEAGG